MIGVNPGGRRPGYKMSVGSDMNGWLEILMSVVGPTMCGLLLHWVLSVRDEKREPAPERTSIPPVDFSI